MGDFGGSRGFQGSGMILQSAGRTWEFGNAEFSFCTARMMQQDLLHGAGAWFETWRIRFTVTYSHWPNLCCTDSVAVETVKDQKSPITLLLSNDTKPGMYKHKKKPSLFSPKTHQSKKE